MIVSLLCRMTRHLLSIPGVLLRHETSRDAELLVLRHENRRPFVDAPVPAAHRQITVRAAELERPWLHVVPDRSERAQLQRFVGKDYESDPLVVVLCSFYDGRLAELQAGQAMQRVLLAATTLGLSASFLSQPVKVPGIRDELRRALGGSLVPQTMLRIGFGSPGAATSSTNPLIDYHLVYIVVVIALAAYTAGDAWGLGRQWAKLDLVRHNRWLR
jgi:hypothetical protein